MKINNKEAELRKVDFGEAGKGRLNTRGYTIELLEQIDCRIIQNGTGHHMKRWELWAEKGERPHTDFKDKYYADSEYDCRNNV